ncbi:3-hydroxyacyl-CoA dehydrogenase NAD-binding domain-containing protein, partial [Salmonella enterica subsp. enterica serovar Braenderup]
MRRDPRGRRPPPRPRAPPPPPATILRNYEASASKGKLTREQVGQRMELLRTTLAYNDIRDADLVIEAVFEDIAIKQSVFHRLDEVMKPGAILASNTSTLDID